MPTIATIHWTADASFAFQVTGNAATVVGNRLAFHWTADAEL